ncbi:MAG TPA: penicillin-binding protein activator, partial [Gammaproteobacteria bacterium]|nr:penicillin-binding protein activator [Gammaproteobacteria bacterium]
MQARSAAATLGAFALALLVAGCATGPSAPRASSGGKAATPLEARGRYEAAADAWLKAAAGLQGSRQAEARLRAAEDYEKAKKPQAAWRAIEPMAISDLPPKERFDGALTKARLALAVHRPQDALVALAAAPAPPGRAEQLQFLALKGQVEFAADDPRTGLETLVERGTLVTSQDQVLANDRLIWSELGHASNLPEPQGLSPTAVGWVKLARIQRNAWLAPGEFTQQLQAWRIAYPNHPADYGLLAEIQSRAASFGSYPAQVALLLPLSGPYASQGAAVEHGLL